MKRIIAVVGLAMLAGCLPLSSLSPREYYVLSDLESVKAMPQALSHQALLVSPTSVSEFYDSQSLVFSRASNQRATTNLQPGPSVRGKGLPSFSFAVSPRAEASVR